MLQCMAPILSHNDVVTNHTAPLMALTGVLRCRSTSLRHKYISEPLRDDVHVLVLLSGQLLARVQPRQYLLLPNPAKMVSSSGVVARDCCDTSGSPFLDSAEKSALS